MFNGWQTFYQMTAEAAATLVGLVFIVITLTSSRQASGTQNGMRLFITPTVFHLASVLVISALALAPDGEGTSPSLLMLAWSVAALGNAVWVAIGVWPPERRAHWSDFWWYGFAPTAAFAGLVIASSLAWACIPHAPYALALVLLGLLLVAIRNAWDLATWLAYPRPGPEPVSDPEAGD
jgi:hypothetical protein